jgi:hypothetical protein
MPWPLLVLLLAGIEVTGDTTCPTAAEIATRLAPLLPAQTQPSAAHRVTVRREPAALLLTLEQADGATMATRRLAASAPCADLAAAAAVVIATWQVELEGQGTIGLWLDAPPAPVPPPDPPPRRPAVSLGVAGHAARAAGDTAPAAGLEAVLGLGEGRGEAWLGLTGIGMHGVAHGPGRLTWSRLAVQAGARATVRSGWLRADGGAGVGVSYLRLAGAGYDPDRTAAALDPGVTLSARLGVERAGLYVWGGATLAAWPLTRELRVENLAAPRRMPRGEVLLSLGVQVPIMR